MSFSDDRPHCFTLLPKLHTFIDESLSALEHKCETLFLESLSTSQSMLIMGSVLFYNASVVCRSLLCLRRVLIMPNSSMYRHASSEMLDLMYSISSRFQTTRFTKEFPCGFSHWQQVYPRNTSSLDQFRLLVCPLIY